MANRTPYRWLRLGLAALVAGALVAVVMITRPSSNDVNPGGPAMSAAERAMNGTWGPADAGAAACTTPSAALTVSSNRYGVIVNGGQAEIPMQLNHGWLPIAGRLLRMDGGHLQVVEDGGDVGEAGGVFEVRVRGGYFVSTSSEGIAPTRGLNVGYA